jgi:hypothetical protein
MLLTMYLTNPCAISQTINQGHQQHAKEQYLSGHLLPKGRRATTEAPDSQGSRSNETH